MRVAYSYNLILLDLHVAVHVQAVRLEAVVRLGVELKTRMYSKACTRSVTLHVHVISYRYITVQVYIRTYIRVHR